MLGACRREQGRGGLRAIGPAQSTSDPDAGLGGLSLRRCLKVGIDSVRVFRDRTRTRTPWRGSTAQSLTRGLIEESALRRPAVPSRCPFPPKGAVVWPTWGRSFAVSGKMPQRNTRRACGKPVSHLRETLAAVPRPCSAESYESRRVGRRRKTETPAGRERPLRKRLSLAQTGLSERSLPGSFLAGRRGALGGRREVSRRAPGPSFVTLG